MPISDHTREQMRQIAARYPSARSALLPMLPLAQSEEDEITTDGITLAPRSWRSRRLR